LLTTFDFPNPIATSPQRESTTVPPQALYLMNSPFAADAATRVAKRSQLMKEATSERIAAIYELLFSRPPTAEDLVFANEFLGAQPDDGTWTHYVHGLVMTNEFVFVD
jgi:hypothetical protein